MSWGFVFVDLQKHTDFIPFELRISLVTWKEAEMQACWFLRDGASQQPPCPSASTFFAIFLGNHWECAVSLSYQLPGVGSPPSHFKQGNREGEGHSSHRTQDVPAGARAFADTIPRLFPCHLGFPLFSLILERPLVTHIRKGFVYPYRGNNWKQVSCPAFSHSIKPRLTLCDQNKQNKTKEKQFSNPKQMCLLWRFYAYLVFKRLFYADLNFQL